MEEEQLGVEDFWRCPKCKQEVAALKKIDFHSLPKIMIVQLKRFQYTRWSRERLNNPVTFPLSDLNLNDLVV